jgi:beta-lactamase class A
MVLRLLVLGVGLGVLTGTVLKQLAPRVAQGAMEAPRLTAATTPVPSPRRGLPMGRFEPRRELTALSQRWKALAAAQKDLKVGAYLLVLDDGRFAQLAPTTPLPAASSIKTPILLVALEDLDGGKIRWDDSLPLTKEVVGGGAGWMASRPLGTRFPFHEAATEMIRVSDNTATNLLIRRVGGKLAINSRFQSLGLPATVVNNFLPDLEGTNTTSPMDLARAIALVDTGEKLSPRARDHFRSILATSRTNTLLPTGFLKGLGMESADPDTELLARGITVLNKTGDIGIAYADAGLIELPNGQRAVAAFMVKGPFNDPRSTDLIRALAAAASETLVGKSAAPVAPSPSPAPPAPAIR